MILDHNLYCYNGWRPYGDGQYYAPGNMAILKSDGNTYLPTLRDIQDRTPWEAHGVEDGPVFKSYNP